MRKFLKDLKKIVDRITKTDEILDELIDENTKRNPGYQRAVSKGEKYLYLQRYRGENAAGVKRLARECEELKAQIRYLSGGCHTVSRKNCGYGFSLFVIAFIAFLIMLIVVVFQNST